MSCGKYDFKQMLVHYSVSFLKHNLFALHSDPQGLKSIIQGFSLIIHF